ncbi:DNA excision repair protein Rad2 [Aspergillus steynii IBT 23096]|uniref:DNA excision repair protein Rad2 n=1 Tax=Aspergillus steynii IBT 23096 TaxID=1392250 RepID=A0A2I2FXZ9_9EURO|nr:DNA excision repair protein Rad2 [Aspergillus steynii IBT 23096]PLB45503.1 DNA excision repair protein Rad2 [Aspergillus steynii IBT 23096]
MGVHGLWNVVQPCARPIKLETLNKRRLAVDASIWIYQFLKAVRDKEGNALRNSHIVGFFRRICKLLYFGIKPVFVFDGGAPILKRQTIAGRQKRREGRREDAVRTAGKLLAVQMQRTAEEEATRRKNATAKQAEEEVSDRPVYAEEAFMTDKEKQQGRSFKKKDAYHLPDMQVSLESMGAPNDPRIMSQEELEEYARQFHRGEDINLYDFSKIDFDSPFFISLPATDRYNILNAARLRSRLRMGYSKEQLDHMFPDRMAFSKFQIERVKERNDLTQRLMNINGMNGEEAFYNSGQRIAGERGKEYVLVKDNTVEGGWVLGVVGNKDEGREGKPIDVDQYGMQEILPAENSSDDDDGFEDVPVEGLNRLPRLPFLQEGVLDDSVRQQMQRTSGRRASARSQDFEDDSLFVPDSNSQALRQGHGDINGLFEEGEDEDLQRAIQMSLESEGQQDDDMPDIQLNRNTSHLLPGNDATKAMSLESDDDDALDFGAALAQSKRTKKEPINTSAERPVIDHPFDGPLPFESMKRSKPPGHEKYSNEKVYEHAGGFEKEPSTKSESNIILPPWFSGSNSKAEFITDNAYDSPLPIRRDIGMTPDHFFLKNHESPQVIDVDKPSNPNDIIDLESDVEEGKNDAPQVAAVPSPKNEETGTVPGVVPLAAQDNSGTERHTVPSPSPEFEDVPTQPQESVAAPRAAASPSPEFEDVTISPERRAAENVTTELEPQAALDLIQAENLAREEEEFSDPEDEDLMRQLAAEGEEHVRFAATLNSAPQGESSFDYEQELKQLRSQQKKDRRDADEVSQIMITECQQLLKLFGLPYVTAPMEAEAQCAELVSLGLVDGIITDDSDCFLFGGTRIYKNMFNQSKFVECYLTSDLEKEYALHRQKLISFSHLLGSDYTEGIPGIGPVTALEIITEFASLEEFRDWWTQVQMGVNMAEGGHAAFYKKFKKQATKIFLPPSFPDSRVDEAYFEPEVDSDPSPFQWGVPDLHSLRHFLMTTIGWSQERTDEVLVPVIRDMNQREQEGTQSNITNFFHGPQGAGAFAPRVRAAGQSRMEKAFSRLRREAGADHTESAEVDGEESPGNRGGRTTGTKRGTRDGEAAEQADSGDAKTSKKRKTRQRK